MKKIVTSYEEADLDGVASSYAYNEYLNKIGENSDYYIYGTPKKEVLIVCDIFGIKLNGAEEIEENQDVIIMDANNIEEFKFVKPNITPSPLTLAVPKFEDDIKLVHIPWLLVFSE